MEEIPFCPNCEHPVDEVSKFCANCGQKNGSFDSNFLGFFREFISNLSSGLIWGFRSSLGSIVEAAKRSYSGL